MGYNNTTLRPIKELTPEELHLGITIAAERYYEARMAELALEDWYGAVEVVNRTMQEGQHPTDDQICPVAEMFYENRMDLERSVYCKSAQDRIKERGNNHPSQSEVLSTAAVVAEEERKALQDGDWYQAEKDAYELGMVPFPTDRIREQRDL